jgi:hypothetical protein
MSEAVDQLLTARIPARDRDASTILPHGRGVALSMLEPQQSGHDAPFY